MVNLNVQYRGPDPSLITLTNELRAHYGQPARTYEYVTGYKSASNLSGHNPDSDGIVHAVDIFTDDNGNIPETEGRALAERLRKVGAATNRFAYLIHDMSASAPRPMIAGQFNGWQWQTYNGPDAHSDHIHISIADLYWGDPNPVSAAVSNDTSRWGVTGIVSGQSSNIAPIIQEDDMSQAQVDAIIASVNFAFDRLITELPDRIADAVLTKQVPHKDPITGKDDGQTTSLATMAGFADFQATATRDTVASAARAMVDAVVAAPGPDAAAAAEAAYDAFLTKLDGVTIKVGTK